MATPDASAPVDARHRAPAIVVGLPLLAAALVAYHWKLLFGGSLDALDWQQHYPFYEWIRMSLREHGQLPLYLPRQYQTWSYSLTCLPESPILNPLIWLLYFISAQAYLKLLFISYATAAVLGAFLLARDLGASPLLAALLAAIYGLQGFALSNYIVGHHWVLGVYLWPFAGLLFRRAVGGAVAPTLGLAATCALLVLCGQHHPAIWLVAMLGAWAGLWSVADRSLAPLRTYAIAMLLMLGLSAARVLPSAFGFASFVPPERFGGLPMGQLARALTTGGPTFQSGYGFGGMLVPFSWENDCSLGLLGALLLAAGLWFGRRSREAVLVLITVATLALVVDLGLDPWVVAGQRVPARLLSIVMFASWIVAARGLGRIDARLFGGPHSSRLRTPFLLGLMVLLVGERYWETRPWIDFGAGNPIFTRPWSPPLPRVESGEASVSVISITPNRLMWDVVAKQPSELLLPLQTSWRKIEWRTEGFSARRQGRLVLVEVPAGHHVLRAEFVPFAFREGIMVSVATAAGIAVFLLLRRLRRSRMPPIPSAEAG